MTKLINEGNKIRKSPHLTALFRLILGFVFIYASLDKIADPDAFAITIQNYQLVPLSITNLIAIFLPWLEFYCGILLLVGWWHQAAAFWVVLMTIVFLVSLISVYARGLDIDCGCFGSGSTVDLIRIIEDLFMLALSLHISFYPTSSFSLENSSNKI
jgi:putative oxidoreductase